MPDAELHRLKQVYRGLDGHELYEIVENARSLIEMRYGRYQGVFSSTSPHSPTDSDLDAVRRGVAARTVWADQIQEVMA